MLGACSVHEASNTASGLATMGVEEYQLPIGAAICLSQATLSNYIRVNWRKNKLKCMLQRWHRFANKRIRLEQLMIQHLIKWSGHYKSKAMSIWKYRVRKSRRKRQGILRLISGYSRVRLRYGLNKFKTHTLKVLIQLTASVGNFRTIALCKEKHTTG